jgi:hypothetical protein
VTELPREARLARTLRMCNLPEEASEVADQLDSIGEYSTSYPFLALARRIDADYGDVLWFADYLTGCASQFLSDPRILGALDRLSDRQKGWIVSRLDNMRVKRKRWEGET